VRSSPGQAIEIKEHDGRGIERQELAQSQAADDGVAERLAYLGARSRAQHERYGPRALERHVSRRRLVGTAYARGNRGARHRRVTGIDRASAARRRARRDLDARRPLTPREQAR